MAKNNKNGTKKPEIPEIVSAYFNAANIEIPVSARIVSVDNPDGHMTIDSVWETQDLRNCKRKHVTHSYIGEWKPEWKLISTVSQDSTPIASVAYNKKGEKQAVLWKECKPPDSHLNLEIWNSDMKYRFNVCPCHTKAHGDIYNNEFSNFEWSQNGEKLLYIAEEEIHNKDSLFKSIMSNENKQNDGCLFREDWGEQLTSAHHPVICVANSTTETVEVLSVAPDTKVSLGQAIWGPNDEHVVCVGWFENPFRLGMKYCTNRQSALFSHELKTATTSALTDNIHCVYSPRFSPSKDFLVYLENEKGGPHHQCAILKKLDWATKKASTITEVVPEPLVMADAFTGIYAIDLPRRCFSMTGDHLIFSNPWKSSWIATAINMNIGTVSRLFHNSFIGFCDVLDVHDNLIIAAASSPNIEPFLLLGYIHEELEIKVSWAAIQKEAPCYVVDVAWTFETFQPHDVEPKYDLDYEGILVRPVDKVIEQIPLIVWPHGGPHSSFVSKYLISVTAFVKLGFAVFLVNYRGSIGFGQNSINSLLGHIGTHDVNDVHFGTEDVRKKYKHTGPVVLYGGSHGGFLIAHLIGQYASSYDACCMRNPVVDIPVMTEVSDIPDWCWATSGFGHNFKFIPPRLDLLVKMWRKSPMRYAENVSTPTLLLLGKKDRRVPMSQGLKFYHTLKARNITTKAYVYDDDHTLSSPEAQADGFLQTVLFFVKYITWPTDASVSRML